MFLDEKNIDILHFNDQIFTYDKGAGTVGICEYLLQVAMMLDREIGIPFSTRSRSGTNSEVPFCQLVKCITEGALKRVRWKSPIYKRIWIALKEDIYGQGFLSYPGPDPGQTLKYYQVKYV